MSNSSDEYDSSSLFSTLATLSPINPYKAGECLGIYNDRTVMTLWMIATLSVFLGLVSSMYTVFRAYQLFSLADEYEKSIIDLIDEGLQILLPIGICKQICHPTIGAANFQLKNQASQEQRKRQKENRYPDDVTYPPSDIELFYDFFGDEDLRGARTISLMAEKSADDAEPEPFVPVKPAAAQPAKKSIKEAKAPIEAKTPKLKNVNPFRSLFSNRKQQSSYKSKREKEPSLPRSARTKTAQSREAIVEEEVKTPIQQAPNIIIQPIVEEPPQKPKSLTAEKIVADARPSREKIEERSTPLMENKSVPQLKSPPKAAKTPGKSAKTPKTPQPQTPGRSGKAAGSREEISKPSAEKSDAK